MTETMRKRINAAFKEDNRSTFYPDWFVVWNKTLENYLLKKAGICSDSPVIDIGAGFKAKWNWKIERFMVQ